VLVVTETKSGEATHVDLGALLDGRTGPGAVWSMASDDLNVNLVVFGEGAGVQAHVNSEVDVLLVGVEGKGRVVVDDVVHVLAVGQAVLVPKGTRRQIQAEGDRFAYLTCHRRRPHLWPLMAPRSRREKAV
jgi:mannose-6-phosphate isomerase-like protein (cupin superfamily)